MNTLVAIALLLLTVVVMSLVLWLRIRQQGVSGAIAKLVAQTKVRHRGGLTLADKAALGVQAGRKKGKRKAAWRGEVTGGIGFLRPLARKMTVAGLPGAPLLYIIAVMAMASVTYMALARFYEWASPALMVGIAAWGWHTVGQMLLVWMGERRLEPAKQQLPGLFDALSREIRVGGTFGQALVTSLEDLDGDIKDWLTEATHRIAIGDPAPEVLRTLGERTGLEELVQLSIAIGLHEKGGKLKPSLQELGTAARARRDMREMVKTLTTEVRWHAAILSCMPPLAVGAMTFMAPGYVMVLFTDPTGREMFGGALLLLLVSIVGMIRMMKVKL